MRTLPKVFWAENRQHWFTTPFWEGNLGMSNLSIRMKKTMSPPPKEAQKRIKLPTFASEARYLNQVSHWSHIFDLSKSYIFTPISGLLPGGGNAPGNAKNWTLVPLQTSGQALLLNKGSSHKWKVESSIPHCATWTAAGFDEPSIELGPFWFCSSKVI